MRFILLLLALPTLSFAAAPPFYAKSAHREPLISYRAYKAHAEMLALGNTVPTTTPVDESRAFGTATLPAAPTWEDASVMQKRFQDLRDARFLIDADHPGFMRRSTWLFPDDGCFARAALAIRNLSQWKQIVPKKIFVFGDLQVNTANAPGGLVTWWYHVAPLVEVNGEKFVLDPAIEPKNPLRLADWLARMSSKPNDLEVAVCGSGSYTPYDPCERDTDGVEDAAMTDQNYFLGEEWNRLLDLNRKPENELGDLPPWL